MSINSSDPENSEPSDQAAMETCEYTKMISRTSSLLPNMREVILDAASRSLLGDQKATELIEPFLKAGLIKLTITETGRGYLRFPG